MENAAAEEKEIALKLGHVDKDNIPWITVNTVIKKSSKF